MALPAETDAAEGKPDQEEKSSGQAGSSTFGDILKQDSRADDAEDKVHMTTRDGRSGLMLNFTS
jgi:hypothetical protein